MSKYFSVYIDDELREKLKFLAKEDHRSATKQVIYYVQEAIKAFEAEHGPIPVVPPKEDEG